MKDSIGYIGQRVHMNIHDASIQMKNYTLVGFVFAFACTNPSTQVIPSPESKALTDLQGNWYFNQWTNYHTLIVSDTAIFVDNNIDSVFFVQYSVSRDTLKTWTSADQVFTNRIIKLTSDTLILEGIFDNREVRTYLRKNHIGQ